MNPEDRPNLYRCETCLNGSCEYFKYLGIWCTEGRYIGSAAAITWDVGCASHSLFRSDVDNILTWMEQYERRISTKDDYGIAWLALRARINSLVNGRCKL